MSVVQLLYLLNSLKFNGVRIWSCFGGKEWEPDVADFSDLGWIPVNLICGFSRAPTRAGGAYALSCLILSLGVRPTVLNLGSATFQLCEQGQLLNVSDPLFEMRR